jgi:ABC-type sugar transport system permease subunit
VSFPLLLISVTPLMIASFAFNFNNFNNIYLLTGGGPSVGNSPIAGATDILISYTYKDRVRVGQGPGLRPRYGDLDSHLRDRRDDLRGLVLAHQSTGEPRMSTREAELSVPATKEHRKKKGPSFADTWWRHLLALIAAVISLFPVAYIISAAFNADDSLSGASLIPRHVTLDNFRSLFSGQRHVTGHATFQDAHYLRWFLTR